MTVITQFITTDGTAKGDLKEIKRFYKQGGKVIPGGSITDASNKKQKTEFGEKNDFAKYGGMKGMGESFKKNMVLVLSIWGDPLTNMDWLDSTTKPAEGAKASRGKPLKGTVRGPCKVSTFEEMMEKNADATVAYSDIQVNKISKY